MKWALLALACVSLLICYQIGPLGGGVPQHTGTLEFVRITTIADTVTYSAGAIAAGLIGGASALGAALIQVSENKKRD